MIAIAPGARVEVVPNGVDAARWRPTSGPAGAPLVVFCGVMNYAPNEEAAIWFVRDVWPLVLASRPDARFEIIGSNPTATVQALADPNANVTVVGAVPDVAPYLWRAAVSVAPLQTARGIQNKVLEAVAAGLPTVITPIVAEGLPSVVLSACRMGASPQTFADAVLTYLEWTPEQRRELALTVDFGSLSWERTLAPVHDILAQAAASRA
jgi:glycosyltransferase involved in cell wall biosynthesis